MDEAVEAFVVHDGVVILECSDAFCDLFRCPCGSLAGRRMESIINDPDLQRLALARGRRIMADAGDRVFHQDYDFERCDGSTFWGRAISRRIAPDRYHTVIRWQYDD